MSCRIDRLVIDEDLVILHISGRIAGDITSRVVNAADGFHIWPERLEIEPDTQSFFEISERIASALINRIRPLGTKKLNVGPTVVVLWSQGQVCEGLL
jgi:hypothetical protein